MQGMQPRTLFEGDAATARLSACAGRRRRLQQIRTMMEHPDRSHVVDCLKRKLAEDPDVSWAAWGMMRLTTEMADALVQAAKIEKERALCEARIARSESFHQWVTVETKGSTKQLLSVDQGRILSAWRHRAFPHGRRERPWGRAGPHSGGG